MQKDTIEKIEEYMWDEVNSGKVSDVLQMLQLRILIQIAKELRVLAQRSE